MANRLVGNVYIIDSQMNAAPLQGPGVSSWLSNSYIQLIKFWGISTAAVCELAFISNTTNLAFRLTLDAPENDSMGGIKWARIGGVRFEELTSKTLTAGTAWIYFK